MANLLIKEHGGFRSLLEFTLGAILRYPYYFIITAVRSLEERLPLMQLAGRLPPKTQNRRKSTRMKDYIFRIICIDLLMDFVYIIFCKI